MFNNFSSCFILFSSLLDYQLDLFQNLFQIIIQNMKNKNSSILETLSTYTEPDFSILNDRNVFNNIFQQKYQKLKELELILLRTKLQQTQLKTKTYQLEQQLQQKKKVLQNLINRDKYAYIEQSQVQSSDYQKQNMLQNLRNTNPQPSYQHWCQPQSEHHKYYSTLNSPRVSYNEDNKTLKNYKHSHFYNQHSSNRTSVKKVYKTYNFSKNNSPQKTSKNISFISKNQHSNHKTNYVQTIEDIWNEDHKTKPIISRQSQCHYSFCDKQN